MGSRGKRYSDEGKLNYKKIFAVIMFFVVLVMIVLGLKKILSTTKTPTGRISTVNYFSVYNDGKWGVINSSGEIVIEPQYKEMIVIPNSTKAFFVCTYNANYETGEYNTKIVNEKNEEVISGYDNINFIDMYDENGKLVYLDNILKVEKNKKYGLVSLNGDKILDCEYDDISILQEVSNSIIVKKDEKIGLCDYNGKIIIEPKFLEIKAIGKDYKNGYITVSSDKLFGIIDFNSGIIFDNKYLDIKPVYSSNKYAVKMEDKYKIINKSETVLLDVEFDDVRDIQDDEIIYMKDNKYGVIDTDGKIKIEPQYEEMDFLSETTYKVKSNGKYGVINSGNELEIENKYIDIEYITSAGVIIAKSSNREMDLYDTTDMNLKLKVESVEIKDNYMIITRDGEKKYYNFKFEEKEAQSIFLNNTIFADKQYGKYGFIDDKSNIIVDYIYDEVTEFNEYGFAGVKLNGLWGVINLEGNEIVKPKYNLDNNKTIDFIGKWHIGIDNNYYTDM